MGPEVAQQLQSVRGAQLLPEGAQGMHGVAGDGEHPGVEGSDLGPAVRKLCQFGAAHPAEGEWVEHHEDGAAYAGREVHSLTVLIPR
ncbi:hypothetical protein [Nesterenkonia pannonica]|uniref:hypothetical protein n=1 Tax=Nesterenkonia pannonica TaxID=1548602 RepID=UPI0021641696|nr:hypothetical protein [Nesterenkonia pannonica]